MKELYLSQESIEKWRETCNRNRYENDELVTKKILRAINLGKMIYRTKITYETSKEVVLFTVFRFYDIDIHVIDNHIVDIYRNREMPLVKTTVLQRTVYDIQKGIPSRFSKGLSLEDYCNE